MIDKMKELQSKMFNEGVTDIYVAKEEVAELGRAGLIEIAGEPDAAGLLCVKISTKGAELLDSTPSDFPVKEAVVKQTVEVDDLEVEEENSSIEIETGVIIQPIQKKGGRRRETFPFSKLEIGQSFHVKATKENPEPSKKMASTVSSATNRFKIEDPEGGKTTNRNGEVVPLMIKTRVFSLRTVDETDPKGVGVRIYRTK